MNWHETIETIRNDAQYNDLVRLAYFDADLRLNVERFGVSEEFAETIMLLKKYALTAKSILDVGAGNGISTINLALKGFDVTVVEPDPSDSVGANAIRVLQKEYGLNNIEVYESYAEEVGFKNASFDVVYVRQAMHHAYELKKFLAECARVLKPGGLLLTIRDHVIYNEKDKAWFLESHPLHKFYGGENAFTAEEYKNAMQNAGLTVLEELKYYDSPINYFPFSTSEIEAAKVSNETQLKQALNDKLGFLSKLPLVFSLYKAKNGYKDGWLNEKMIPGRMYSYICRKV